MSSQKDRVLAQLRRGPVTIGDFDRDTAVDGGARITRLAARIQDLQAEGYAISRRMVRLGGALVAEYSLSSCPDPLSPVRQAPAAHTFPLPVPRATTSRNAIDDDWDWEAA